MCRHLAKTVPALSREDSSYITCKYRSYNTGSNLIQQNAYILTHVQVLSSACYLFLVLNVYREILCPRELSLALELTND